MIAHLSGTIQFRGTKFLIVDVGGVGYKVTTSLETLKSAGEQGAKISLFTYLYVRETAMELYGFNSIAELEFFEMLIGISGIGPKSAVGVLSVAPIDSLKRAIASGESSYLTKVSGIGRRIAEKIILELKDKLGGVDGFVFTSEDTDALDALVALGYNAREAREALHRTSPEKSIDEKIKEALRALGGSQKK